MFSQDRHVHPCCHLLSSLALEMDAPLFFSEAYALNLHPSSRILLINDILFPVLSVILFLTYVNMLKTYFFKRKNREIAYTPVYTTFVSPASPYLVGSFLFFVLFQPSIYRGELVFPVHLIHPHTLLPQSF